MATVKLIQYEESNSEVRAIYDDIRKTRGGEFINNFWLALADNPEQLARTARIIKNDHERGGLDPLPKKSLFI